MVTHYIRYTYYFFLSCFLLVWSTPSAAQYNETIQTDRPGQAIGPFAVGRGMFQVQAGLDAGGADDNILLTTGLAQGTVFRLGILRHFEINAAYEYRRDNYTQGDSSFATNGLSLASLGTRINIVEGKDAVPAIGLQLSCKLPGISSAYGADYIAPQILIIASQALGKRFSFLLNFGMDYNGFSPDPSGVYVANLGYSISSKWSTFIENYGRFNGSLFENRWDTGLGWLVNNDLQLDIYGGAGYNYGKLDYFASIGVSWRTLALRH